MHELSNHVEMMAIMIIIIITIVFVLYSSAIPCNYLCLVFYLHSSVCIISSTIIYLRLTSFH